MAGATGALGNEVLRRVAGSIRYGHVQVLAREPVRPGIARVGLDRGYGVDTTQWQPLAAEGGAAEAEGAHIRLV